MARLLVRRYDTIYHEDLQTANMLTNHHLTKSSADTGWSAFLRILSCKAAEAGKTVVAVPPAFTSQACSGCGVLVQKGLSVRWHGCPACGTSLHRDHNAAHNILAWGTERRSERGAGQAPSGANVGRWAERSLSIFRMYSGECQDGTSGAFGVNTPSSRWVLGSNSGAALRSFAQNALKQAGGAHPSMRGWYGSFLRAVVIPHATVWAYLITFGETPMDIGLIFGALTGIAAFFGVLMNFNYLLATTVSTNPVLGFRGILLILAWCIVGYWGLDRWLLPLLGTP
jgi:hypothetical protein